VAKKDLTPYGVATRATTCCWWKYGFSPASLKVDTEVVYVVPPAEATPK
jgi:hypothetical protein